MTDFTEKENSPLLKRLALLGTIISVLGGGVALFKQFKPESSSPNLRGTWKIKVNCEYDNLNRYTGDEYIYEVYVDQKDNFISGKGEQTLYNGKVAASHFKLEWTDTEILGDSLFIRYDLKANRDVFGQFKLKIDPENPKRLFGTYNSAAADSYGSVEVYIK